MLGHFVGASRASSDLHLMLRRFCLEMRRRFRLTEILVREDGQKERIQQRVPDDVSVLPHAFKEMLARTPVPPGNSDQREIVEVWSPPDHAAEPC